MPKVGQAHRESRRATILAAAEYCFARNGFHQTTMDDIVKRSGLSKGAVYGYFASKGDLIEALANVRHEAEAAINAAALSAADPVDGLIRLIHAYARELAAKRANDARRVQIHSWAEAMREPRIRRHIVQGLSHPKATVVELMTRGQSTGRLAHDVDAESVARALIALLQGLVLQIAWGEQVDVTACARVAERFLRGLIVQNRSNSGGRR